MLLRTLVEQIQFENDAADDSGSVSIDKKMTEKTLDDTFEVTDTGLNYIKRELDRMNKKASRLGLSPLTLKVLGQKHTKLGDGDVRVINQVKIEGKAPMIDGYEFIANIEHSEAGNIINISPDASLKNLPAEYRTVNATCDHCHTKRDRHNTFVLKDTKSGALKRVGRSCLKNFFPDTDPKALMAYAAMLGKALNIGVGAEDMEDEGGMGGGGSSSKYYDAAGFLVYICTAYLMTGKYLSKSKARQNIDASGGPTTSTGELAMNLRWNRDADVQEEVRKLRPRAEELAAKIEDWKETKDWDAMATAKPELANYFNNMKVISNSQAIQYKNAGYHASLLGLYLRDEMDAVQREKVKAQDYVGKVGEKILIDLTVKLARPFYSAYGAGMMYIFNDTVGNEVVYFASKDMGLDTNETYKVQATVKQQQVSKYNGAPQTIITRAKILD
jgi:hypothetical protein